MIQLIIIKTFKGYRVELNKVAYLLNFEQVNQIKKLADLSNLNRIINKKFL